MKRYYLYFMVLNLFMSFSLFATYTRVNSLGDIENPVSEEISYLIKDDIVDIYFNPAKVNDVRAFILLSSFNLENGSNQDEKSSTFKIINGTVSTTNETSSKVNAYNLTTKIGVLIPLKFINLFINYSPEWNRVKEETFFDSDISTATNQVSKTVSDKNIMRQLAFDTTIGFNLFDKIKTGIRVGINNEKYNQYTIDSDGNAKNKGEYNNNVFLIGAGVEFSFIKTFDISLAGDVTVSSKDESPLYIEGGFNNAGSYNYDTTYKVYNYTYLENEIVYNLRVIPELKLKNDKFFRFLAELSFYNYTKDYSFNQKLNLKDYKMDNFNKSKIILNTGVSFNSRLGTGVQGIYGIKYSGLINGINQYKFYEDKNNLNTYKEYRENIKDNYIGIFSGFDIKVVKILYIRTGISQGIFRYYSYSSIDKNTGIENIEKWKYYFPDTIFTLGFYIMPIDNLTIEFNFSNGKDWSMKNIADKESIIKQNDIVSERAITKNYDFNAGMSVSFKF